MVKLLRFTALVAAAAHLAAFFYVAAVRLTYPFELEWIEGGLADEVRAILRGAPLYGPPSLRQVAFIYPPLYFYASAAAAGLAGGGFLPLRLVSFAATLLCFALVVAMARRAGGGWTAGCLASGLFAATFTAGAGWLSLARVDALYLALLLGGAYALQRAQMRGGGTPPLRANFGRQRMKSPGRLDLRPFWRGRQPPQRLFFSPFSLRGKGGGGMGESGRDPAFAPMETAPLWRRAETRSDVWGYIAAGLLLALSFLTKQSALPLAGLLAAYAALADRRRGWLLGVSFGAAALAASALFNWATQGWYAYFVFNGALGQPMAGSAWLSFWWTDLISPLGLIVLAALTFLAFEWRAGRPVGLWLTLLGGTLGTAYWVRLHLGAVENNLLPLLAVLAVMGGLGAERAIRWAMTRPPSWQTAALALIYTLCLLQFIRLAYNPLTEVPAAANRAAAQALLVKVAGVNGDVLVPQHGALTWLVGKPSYAHLAAMDDVLNTGGTPAALLMADTRAALRERRFAAIIVDGPDFARRFPELEQNYVDGGEVAPGAAFYSITGPRPLPEVIYVPK